MGDRLIQLQTGYQFDDNELSDGQTFNNVLRYGIGEDFEISSVFDYREDQSKKSGIDNLQFGGRYSFNFEDALVQALCLQLRTRFEGSGDYQRERQSFILVSAMNFKPVNFFSYGINLIMQNNGFDSYIQKAYTLNLSFSLSEKLGLFFEPYGSFGRETHVFSLNTGLSYNMSSDLAFDISVGEDQSNSVARFVSLGFSIRRMPKR